MISIAAVGPVAAAALASAILRDTEAALLPRELWHEAAGVRLFALESGLGSGQVVVMLHGGMANHLASLPLVRPLARRFRILTPDLRGSGNSHSAEVLTFDRLADDVAALLDRLGTERAIVGGVSSGSGVALRFALRHPRRVSALILVKPMHSGAQRGYSDAQRDIFARMDALARRAPVEGIAVLRPLYSRLAPGIRERALAMLDGFDAASTAATSRFLASGAQPFASTQDLRSITVPTLLARGDDEMHPAAVSDLLVGELTRPRVLPASASDLPGAIGAFCNRIGRDRNRR